MKNWMGAFGRTLAIFVLSLVVLAAGMALARGADSSLPFLRTLLCCAESIYPLAVAAAVFLGFFIYDERISPLLSWLSLFFIGSFLMAACWAFVWIFPSGAMPAARPLEPKAGTAIEAGGLISYVDEYSGDRALRAAGFDFSQTSGLAGTQPPASQVSAGQNTASNGSAARMTYAPTAARPGSDGLLKIEGHVFPTRPGSAQLSSEKRYPAVEEALRNGLGARSAAFAAGRWLEALFAGLGFIILAAGLASLAGLPDWPLAGFFLTCGGFFLLLLLDQTLASPEFAGLLRPLLSRIGIGSWPQLRVQAAIEALLGLIAGIAGICAKRTEKQNGQL